MDLLNKQPKMRYLIKYLLSITIITICSCKNHTIQINNANKSDSTVPITAIQKTDNSRYYSKQDSVIIDSTEFYTFKMGKKDFNQLIDRHPEFFEHYPSPPDEDYRNFPDSEYVSEVGQDGYYTLYAYFLKQKNGIAKYGKCRNKLIKIYSAINSLFGDFQYGGTYFGHQYSRIAGYAEYSVFLYSQNENNFEKTYDVTKQKDLYIKSLRQLIDDENQIDNNTLGKAKIPRKQRLNKTVDIIDTSITNNFYLRRAQEFQYSHYQYY